MVRSRSSSSSSSKQSGKVSPKAGRSLIMAGVASLVQRYLSRPITSTVADGDVEQAQVQEGANESTSLISHIYDHGHSSSQSVNLKAAKTFDGDFEASLKTRGVVWGILTLLTVAALIVLVPFFNSLPDVVVVWLGGLPQDPHAAAMAILHNAPVIDGHIDLPILARSLFANNVSAIDLNDTPGHVDIPRLRLGNVGGFFWSVYVGCADPDIEGEDFLTSTWRVRDTLEQIDVARLLIDKYPETFRFAISSEDIKSSIAAGKVASLLGVEGGHQLGNSLSVLRQYHALGVRYVTLTHTCHNAFADSCGYAPGKTPLHNGLSAFGYALIDEMNRLGVLVDLSHTSDATASQAIIYSKAPVFWSHSSARAVHDVPRNVPDNILRMIGQGEGKKDGVIMVNFAPQFVADPGDANVSAVANHVEHIASITGKKHVGIGSDFDGIDSTPDGLEDVSKYPALIAELYKRGWTKYELAGLSGANLLRVFQGAEKVSQQLQKFGTEVRYDLYKKRKDLPQIFNDL